MNGPPKGIASEVALEVMGWQWYEALIGWVGLDNRVAAGKSEWQPTSDPLCTERVIERMREHPNPKLRTLRLVSYPYGRSYATFNGDAFGDDDSWEEANGDNHLKVAICKAAVMAVRERGTTRIQEGPILKGGVNLEPTKPKPPPPPGQGGTNAAQD